MQVALRSFTSSFFYTSPSGMRPHDDSSGSGLRARSSQRVSPDISYPTFFGRALLDGRGWQLDPHWLDHAFRQYLLACYWFGDKNS